MKPPSLSGGPWREKWSYFSGSLGLVPTRRPFLLGPEGCLVPRGLLVGAESGPGPQHRWGTQQGGAPLAKCRLEQSAWTSPTFSLLPTPPQL